MAYKALKRPATKKKRPPNDLQRARNDLKQPTASKTQPIKNWTYLQWAKKRPETIGNKQIFRLSYDNGQTVFFSNTFLTQHLVAIIWALLHGESWSQQSFKHLSYVFFIGYSISFFLSGSRAKNSNKSQDSREREKLLFLLLSTISTHFANRSIFTVYSLF